jgi:nucleotide-binding universal stress UspA family protein
VNRAGPGGDGRGTVLVGIDGSDTSLRAVAYAIGLASRQQCALTAVYVSDCNAGPAAGALIAAAAREQAAENLRGLVSDAIGRTGIQGDFIRRSGGVYTELARAADEMHADAVIVGRSAKLGHRLAGSVGARLARNARWLVVVVP